MRTPPIFANASLRLLHAMLVAVALLTVTGGARAAVPLCSEDGRSIVAPHVVKPSSGRAIEAAEDCERLRALLGASKPGKNQRNLVELVDAPPRALPVRLELPAIPCLARLEIASDLRQARPASTDGIFRPPRRG